MAKTHKSQHWVPRSYLSAWVDPERPSGYTPYVNVISRDGREVRRKAPANTFAETDLYTIALPDGSRDLRLEHGLSDLELAFAATRREFLDRRRPVPFMRWMKLILFIAAMHARTPMMRDHFAKFWNELRDKGEKLEARIQSACRSSDNLQHPSMRRLPGRRVSAWMR